MKFCQNCGEAIEDMTSVCPKCNFCFVGDKEDLAVVYNETPKSNIAQENQNKGYEKGKDNRIIPLLQKYHNFIVVVLVALTLVLVVVAVISVTSKNYQECSAKYSEYMENYNENLRISKSYGGYGILESGYQQVADGWKDLADDISTELWGLRIRAIVCVVLSFLCVFLAFKVHKYSKVVGDRNKI